VLLYEPDATAMDLRFRLFGVPVRVHPFFWLMTVLLGWNLTRNPVLPGGGMAELGLWILACFVSILLHEFGHIWMGQVFGSFGHIVLHGFGGLAVGASIVATRLQRILVSAAGPAIQLVLFGLLIGLLLAGVLPYPKLATSPVWAFLEWALPSDLPRMLIRVMEPATPLNVLMGMMLDINLLWPLLNLLPIYPLDGGQISREVCVAASPRNGLLVSLWVSVVLGGVLAVNALLGAGENPRGFLPRPAPTGVWAGILFGLLAYGAWQAIQIEQSRRPAYEEEPDDRLPWER
jgi:Zn-dependent protease